MTDVFLEWNSDFVVSSTGGLLLTNSNDEVRQRLERRLFSAPKSYIWHPEYGAGLPQKIGSTYSASQIQSIVMQQLNLEQSVAPDPPPQLTVTQQPGGYVTIAIKYFDAKAGTAVSFTITS
jgi:hypothetical protein